MQGCLACGRGFHKECSKCRKDKCHPEDLTTSPNEIETNNEHHEDEKKASPKSRKSARENLKDPKSTGRKRAAQLYPINPADPCEWRGLRNCGGGRRPIIGCLDGNQKHRHHGPVKETTRNEQGNVHRICTSCHVHWHELNDLVYNEKDFNLLPHQPVPATDLDIIQNILDWKSGKMGETYELASSKNLEKYNATQTILLPPNPDALDDGASNTVLEPSDDSD